MSDNVVVKAELRSDLGKGASRRLRRTNRVPAVIYGAHKDPVSLSLAFNETVKHLETEAFYSQIIVVEVDGAAEKAVLKDMLRHPAKGTPMHLDFQRVSANETLSMNVPLHFINEDECVGVKEGGVLSHLMTEVSITCLPADLPEYIEVDVVALNIGDSISLSGVAFPDGVESPDLALGDDHDHSVVAVSARKAEESEDNSDVAVADESGADEAAEGDE